MTRGQERRRKQLLVDCKEKGGHYELKEEAIDHTILRTCFLREKGLITKLVKMTRGQERRRKQLLVDSKEKGGHYKLKEEALDHTILRTCF